MRTIKISLVPLLLFSMFLIIFPYITGNNKVFAISNDKWEYLVTEDNTVTITRYLGNDTIVQIPSSIDGRIVTRVEGYEYISIKNITFPSTIEFIDQSVFYRGLVENIKVDINNNFYKSVDGVLFTKNMEKLIAYPMGNDRSTYQIPLGVKVITFNAFATTIYNGTLPLENIDVPKSVTNIEDIHSIAARTANINVAPENETFKSIDGVLFNKSGDELICYPYANKRAEYTIPEGTKKIRYQGFYGTYGIKHYLTTLRLPASLLEFPDLFEIEKLQYIYVDSNNPYYKSVDGVLFNKNMDELISYPMGNSRSSYIIPAGIKTIRYGAFYDIYQYPNHPIKDITIPASVTDFGNMLGKAWENIHLDENHPSLKSISGVVFSKDGKTLVKYPRLKQTEVYSIPIGTESINYSAFFSCNYLKNLVIPDSIIMIEQSSIGWCEELTNVFIYNNKISIGEYNFNSRKKLRIWSYEGSTAHTFALENNIEFKILDNEINSYDLNTDGIVDLFDVVMVAKDTPELVQAVVKHYGEKITH